MDVVVLLEFRNRDLVLAVVVGVVLAAASEFSYTAHLPPTVLDYAVAAIELAMSAAEPRISQLRLNGGLIQLVEFNVPDAEHERSVEQLPLALFRGSFASWCVPEIAVGRSFMRNL